MTESSDACVNSNSLDGIRVLDLSRILAGPTATQLFGDLGADILKIEHPKLGDDTRGWGPPFATDSDGNETSESAYYLCVNRNKRSVAIDISKQEGQTLVKKLLANCDVLVENFKVGSLEKYGLDYQSLKTEFPELIYCSITGYGQTGKNAAKPGYDALAQAAGGIMSITGEPAGFPMKVGVGIADIMCGMYAAVAMLAALRHRDRTKCGQHIDVSLLDTQLAWLANAGSYFLTSGNEPPRFGNAHPNIAPYKTYEVSDGYMVLGVGNDRQFVDFCMFAGIENIAKDTRFNTNANRIRNREALEVLLEPILMEKTRQQWMHGLEPLKVPCGPVNSIGEALTNEHAIERNIISNIPYLHNESGVFSFVSNPLKFSKTPPKYRYAPPILGEQTADILKEFLDIEEPQLSKLRDEQIIK